jgi:hypothetical protein
MGHRGRIQPRIPFLLTEAQGPLAGVIAPEPCVGWSELITTGTTCEADGAIDVTVL